MALRNHGDYLVEFGDMRLTEGYAAWDQVANVARRKVAQFTGRVPYLFVFSSRRRHTISYGDWSSDVCSSDLLQFRELKLEKDPECPVCGAHPTVTELIDYQAFYGVGAEPSYDGVEITAQELRDEWQRNPELVVIDVRESH